MHPVKKDYSKAELLEAAAAFQGHVGPFLVLGLKAGELAIATLEKDPFKMRAEIYCSAQPPQSCLIDGVQFSTGCTMGKGNIILHASDSSPVIIFIIGKKILEIKLKKSVIERLASLKEKKPEELGKELYDMKYDSLFDYAVK